ncbi:MAG: class I SAM-dependent RNA methyltransferase, partial [Sedimentibacter sp.]|nr:class I SAM-dependent RNA methyltransferase [Sedimentibacter sp.]
MLEKGLVKEVEIIDMNHVGQGVARIDNFVVFVSDAITFDMVKIKITDTKKNYATGEIIEIIKPSRYRIKPDCAYSKQCGGCQLTHVDYREQLKYKRNRVVSEFRRARISFDDETVYDTVGMYEPYRYRNKTAFSVTEKNNEIQIGPYEQGTYNTVDINSCLLQ